MEIINLLKNKKIFNDINEEYYNALKTNFRFLGKDIKVVSITSLSQGEGKSTVSINLAVALAKDDLKVLYIDADTRNSSFVGRFKINNKAIGLTGYLSGNSNIEDIIYDTDISGLNVVPSGQFPVNPTTLLQSSTFSNFIEKCRDYYDYVIIDTPPIGMVIDSVIITNYCDGSVLIVEQGKIKREFIKKAIHQLEQTGKLFLGVILNKVDVEDGYYGNYGNYGKIKEII